MALVWTCIQTKHWRLISGGANVHTFMFYALFLLRVLLHNNGPVSDE